MKKINVVLLVVVLFVLGIAGNRNSVACVTQLLVNHLFTDAKIPWEERITCTWQWRPMVTMSSGQEKSNAGAVNLLINFMNNNQNNLYLCTHEK